MVLRLTCLGAALLVSLVACGGSSTSSLLNGGDGGPADAARGKDTGTRDAGNTSKDAASDGGSKDAGMSRDAADASQGAKDAGKDSGGSLDSAGDVVRDVRSDTRTPDSGRDVASSDTGSGDANGADSAACPDEHGRYTIMLSGGGCGNLDKAAAQCVAQTACGISFASSSGTSGKALDSDPNAPIPLAADGSFTGATITEGTGAAARTGCVGAWDPTSSTLTVDCGGTSGTQACIAKLTRSSLMCN